MNETAATLLDTACDDLPSAADHVRSLSMGGYTAAAHLNELQALKRVVRLMQLHEVCVIRCATDNYGAPEIQTDSKGATELRLLGELIPNTVNHYSAMLGGVKVIWVARS